MFFDGDSAGLLWFKKAKSQGLQEKSNAHFMLITEVLITYCRFNCTMPNKTVRISNNLQLQSIKSLWGYFFFINFHCLCTVFSKII